MSGESQSVAARRGGFETSELGAQLGNLMQEHSVRLEAFRDVARLAAELPRENRVEQLMQALPRFEDPAKRDALHEGMGAFLALMGELIQREPGEPTDASQESADEGARDANSMAPPEPLTDADEATDLGPTAATGLYRITATREDGRLKHAGITFADPEVDAVFTSLMSEAAYWAKSPDRREVVLTSLLTAIVGSYETLVGELASTYFHQNPGALGTAPEFSLQDLARFETLEDAREELVRRKVDALDRGLDEVAKWFKSRLDIELNRLAIDWDRLYEIVQRRHLVVHTGGVVTHRYVEKLGNATAAKVGDRLHV